MKNNPKGRAGSCPAGSELLRWLTPLLPLGFSMTSLKQWPGVELL